MERRQNSENAPSSKSSNKGASRRPTPFQIVFLSLFPDFFQKSLDFSLLQKAAAQGLIQFRTVNPRDFALDKHRSVDDSPYGGGEGMVMRVDVLYAAWQSVMQSDPASRTLTLLMTPQGEVFNQSLAKEFSSSFDRLIIVCGHYEGVDERFIELCVDREISIGDYVLTGGEIPALAVADTICRLIPGVVGNERSLTEESFERGLLKYPQYTRPPEFQGLPVPEVLLSGNHGAIEKWRNLQMEKRTGDRRPELLTRKPVSLGRKRDR